jgi:hypothetical protein
MLSVIEAVEVASSHLKLLIPQAEQILLEEVELSDDDQYWLITLSFIHPQDGRQSPLVHALGGSKLRTYKVLKIHGNTGEVRSMKIRELENV